MNARMSPEGFATIANFFSEAALLLSVDGVILGVNRQVRGIGLDPLQVLGCNLTELTTTPEPEVQAYLRRCSRNREACMGTLVFPNSEGECVTCRCDGGLSHHDARGNGSQLLIKLVPREQTVTQFSVLNQKIEELSKEIRRGQLLQTELRNKEESLRITLASIGDGVIVADPEGRVTFLNPVAESLTGWSHGLAHGRPLEAVFHIVNEATRRAVDNPALRAIRDGTVVGLANHTVLISKDKSERPINDSAAPIRDRDNRILGGVLVFRDVSEKRAAEVEQGRLAALVDSSQDAILGLSFEGIVTDWNAGAEKLFGYSAQEVVGGLAFDRIVPDDRRAELLAVLKRAQQGERIVPFESQRIHKDGRRIPVAVRVSPIINRDGDIIGASAIDRDISKQQSADRSRNARLALTELFAKEGNAEGAISGALSILGSALDCDLGCYRQIDGDPQRLRCAQVWNASPAPSQPFLSVYRQLLLRKGEGLPGRAWIEKRPLWMGNASHPIETAPGSQATNHGFHATYACPITNRGEVLGVLEWFSYEPRQCDEDRMELLTTVSAQVGQYLERLEAEKLLRHNEQDLNDFFETAPLGLHWVAPDGTILRTNQAELKILGYARDEYVGHCIAEFHHDPGESRRILQALRAGEQLRNQEVRMRCKDGSVKHVRINSNALREDGRLVRSRCFTRDVTHEKRVEAALRDSEERLRLALDAGKMGSWEWNLATDKLIWSETLELIHGLQPGSFQGTFEAYQRAIHPEDRERVLSQIQQTINSGDTHHLEYRIVLPDQSISWLEARGKLFRDAHGQPTRLVGVCSTITERKQLEHSLRFLAESSRSLTLLVDYKSTLQQVASLAVPAFADWCAVDMLEADGTLQRLAVAHVDPAKEELAGALHRRYVPKPGARHGVVNVLRTGRPEWTNHISDDVLVAIAQDSEHLQIMRELSLKSYICVPLSAKDDLLGVITFVQAESGRRYNENDLAMAEDLAFRAAVAIKNAMLYQQVRDADRRKDEFLAMLGHELRNPLAPIRSGMDILAMEAGKHQEIVELMQEQVEHVVRLVDDLLDVSRIMRDKVELRKECVDLAELIRRSAHAVQPAFDGRSQELIISVSDEPLPLYVDPVRIVQIVENLLNNASKYMDSGGRVDLITQREADDALIVVRDTGFGIEKELLPHIFDLFTQSHRTLDRALGGLGIGLTLVQNLVELHGGSVTAQSLGAGHGSTFTVRLPLTKKPLLEDRAQPLDAETAPLSVVVVDDNRSAAWLLKMLLMRVGDHIVETAGDGSSALLKIKELRPQVAFLDIGLPGMDGHQLAREIRRHREFDDMLLIALTGYGQEEDRRNSLRAGFDVHLVKPPSIGQIREVLTHPKLHHLRQQAR